MNEAEKLVAWNIVRKEDEKKLIMWKNFSSLSLVKISNHVEVSFQKSLSSSLLVEKSLN